MNQPLAALLRENRPALVRELTRAVRERAGPSYARLTEEELLPRMERLVEAWQRSLEENNPGILEEFTRRVVWERVQERYRVEEIQEVITLLRASLLSLVEARYRETPKVFWEHSQAIEDLAHRSRCWVAQIYLEAYEEQMELQKRTLSELSTPVIKVYENVLVLPLVGAIDTERAKRIMEELLLGITRHQAELVIIDITGVPVVDTAVANHLIQTIKAARLLGARSILVGISGEVAQALVHLQIDLSGVVTRSNLQAGIEYALEQMGLEIVPRGSLPAEVPEEAAGEAGP
ncbi:MAG: STAS domain-containing protein [Chloroflexia bacterium]